MMHHLIGEQERMLGRLYRAGEKGLLCRPFADRVLVGELEGHGLAEWVDGHWYLITDAGRQAWERLQKKAKP